LFFRFYVFALAFIFYFSIIANSSLDSSFEGGAMSNKKLDLDKCCCGGSADQCKGEYPYLMVCENLGCRWVVKECGNCGAQIDFRSAAICKICKSDDVRICPSCGFCEEGHHSSKKVSRKYRKRRAGRRRRTTHSQSHQKSFQFPSS
jgi:hypothetical protein